MVLAHRIALNATKNLGKEHGGLGLSMDSRGPNLKEQLIKRESNIKYTWHLLVG